MSHKAYSMVYYFIEMCVKLPMCNDIPCDSSDYIVAYRKISNISRTLVGNKIVDHSDVVGASPVGAAPTTSSFST